MAISPEVQQKLDQIFKGAPSQIPNQTLEKTGVPSDISPGTSEGAPINQASQNQPISTTPQTYVDENGVKQTITPTVQQNIAQGQQDVNQFFNQETQSFQDAAKQGDQDTFMSAHARVDKSAWEGLGNIFNGVKNLAYAPVSLLNPWDKRDWKDKALSGVEGFNQAVGGAVQTITSPLQINPLIAKAVGVPGDIFGHVVSGLVKSAGVDVTSREGQDLLNTINSAATIALFKFGEKKGAAESGIEGSAPEPTIPGETPSSEPISKTTAVNETPSSTSSSWHAPDVKNAIVDAWNNIIDRGHQVINQNMPPDMASKLVDVSNFEKTLKTQGLEKLMTDKVDVPQWNSTINTQISKLGDVINEAQQFGKVSIGDIHQIAQDFQKISVNDLSNPYSSEVKGNISEWLVNEADKQTNGMLGRFYDGVHKFSISPEAVPEGAPPSSSNMPPPAPETVQSNQAGAQEPFGQQFNTANVPQSNPSMGPQEPNQWSSSEVPPQQGYTSGTTGDIPPGTPPSSTDMPPPGSENVPPSESPQQPNIFQRIGKKMYESAITPNIKEAELLQNRAAGELNFEPRTRAQTAMEQGIKGTEESIGKQAVIKAKNLYKNEIEPAIKNSTATISREELFKPLEDKVANTAEPGKQAALSKALEAIKEEYSDPKFDDMSLEQAQAIKRGLDEFTPSKAFKGQEIANEYTQLRNDMADTIRQHTYDKLGDMNIKQKYLDYGNLKEMEKIGIKARTTENFRKGFGGFWSSVFDMVTAPVKTIGGQVLYRLGGGGVELEFKAPPGISTLDDYLKTKNIEPSEFINKMVKLSSVAKKENS